MAVALILDFPGGTREQYDRVVAQMDLGGRVPEGAVFHAAGPYEDGWRVVDVWDSPAAFESFRDEKIGPLTAAEGMAPPKARMVELTERKPASGAQPAFLQVLTLPGFSAEDFHAADDQVLADGMPPSMTFHVNGSSEDGHVVIDAWESRQARDRFIQERVEPVMKHAALTGAPRFEDLDVEATLAERPAPAHA